MLVAGGFLKEEGSVSLIKNYQNVSKITLVSSLPQLSFQTTVMNLSILYYYVVPTPKDSKTYLKVCLTTNYRLAKSRSTTVYCQKLGSDESNLPLIDYTIN